MTATRAAQLLLLAVLLGAALGLGRLEEDGLAEFGLPAGHELPALSATLDELTGGDDVLAVVLWEEEPSGGGLLDGEGVAAIEQVRVAMEALAELESVRAVTTAPLLAELDGAVTAHTPLSPAPEDEAAWASARAAVLADPLVVNQLVSVDGATAVVAGWVFRGPRSQMIARRATKALLDPDFRSSSAGAAVQEAVNGARLALALGEASGSVDVEISRRLDQQAEEDDQLAATVAAWRASEADDPDEVALEALRRAVDSVELPAGLRGALAGPAVIEAGLAEAVPRSVARSLAFLVLLGGIAGWSRRRSMAAGAAALAVGGTFVAGLGAIGWLSAPLGVPTALCALTGSAWALALIGARGPDDELPVRLYALGFVFALPWAWALRDAGGAAAPVACVLAATGAAWLAGAVPGRGEAAPAAGRSEPSRAVVYVAILLALGSIAVLVRLPVGLDAAALLGSEHPDGEGTARMASELGSAPVAYLVYRDGESPRALATPDALTALRLGQTSLEVDAAVAGTESWADFVSVLHRSVAGDSTSDLPRTRDLVDQYLLMFGRPDDTRTLVARDLSLGVALVRFTPGGGAELGRLAELWPASQRPLALAGDAVQIGLSARLGTRRMVAALPLALLLLLVGLSRGRLGAPLGVDVISVLASGGAATAVAGWSLGSVSPVSCAAGLVAAAVVGVSAVVGGRPARVAPLLCAFGALGMVPGPVGELTALGLGAAAGCLAGALLRFGWSSRAEPEL